MDRSQEVAETRMRWLGIFSRADRIQMKNQEKSCRREVHSLYHHLLWAPRKIVSVVGAIARGVRLDLVAAYINTAVFCIPNRSFHRPELPPTSTNITTTGKIDVVRILCCVAILKNCGANAQTTPFRVPRASGTLPRVCCTSVLPVFYE